jgi:hypothetical protein
MFSVRIKLAPIFIVSDNQVSEAVDCSIIYNGRLFNFIEQNGLYASSNFFEDMYEYENLPEQCFDENGELLEQYRDSIFLNIISGGWNESLTNLLQTIDFLGISIEEDEENILSFITRLKNGEGIRRVVYGQDEIMLKNYEGDEVQIDYLDELIRMTGNQELEEYIIEIDEIEINEEL